MNVVPVANQREDEQYERDDQQASRLRGVHGMPMVFVRGIGLGIGGRHADIVALPP